jgi:hypothetical protein
MTDIRKDHCDRCGYNVMIFHRGQVPRRPPYKGFKEIKYCGPCYEMIDSGRDTTSALANYKGAAVTNFDQHSRPKSSVPDPTTEMLGMKIRVKVQWYVSGLITGMIIGGLAALVLLWRGF